MNKQITLIILAFIPATSWSAGFNCTKANTFIEQAICNDQELSTLDNYLMTAYKKAIRVSDKDTLKIEQRIWLKTKRNKCENNSCLKKAYLARLKELSKDTDTPKTINKKPINLKSDKSNDTIVKNSRLKEVVLTPIHSKSLDNKTNGKSDISDSNASQTWEEDIIQRIEQLKDSN